MRNLDCRRVTWTRQMKGFLQPFFQYLPRLLAEADDTASAESYRPSNTGKLPSFCAPTELILMFRVREHNFDVPCSCSKAAQKIFRVAIKILHHSLATYYDFGCVESQLAVRGDAAHRFFRRNNRIPSIIPFQIRIVKLQLKPSPSETLRF